MHLDGTGQTLTLSPVLAGDMLESLFIAEVGPVKDDDSNHDSYTIDDMEVFDLNTEKLHPSSRMVYFALETKAIELGPFIRGDPLKIDINDFLEVHHKETHYRWAIEGAIQSVVRLNTPLDHEVVPILTINGLDDDLLGTVIIGTVYGKRDGVPGRVSIGSQRFLIKKDTSRSCQGLPTNRTCTCNPGYELADVACKDVDECQLGTRRCLPNSTCVNTPGSYRCDCPMGYHGDGISGCQDTDECVTSIALCDDNAVCVNTLGSYRCICHEGFIGDGFDCLAISEWTSWSLWSSCLGSCGRSSRMRYRDCSHPESGMICEGPSVDTEPCESKPCPVDGGWGEWSPWSVCSKSCGGHREKVRACDNPSPTDGGLFCIGEMYQINGCESRSECPVFPRLLKVNGGWSQWSVWSLCSTSCGPGLQSRRRHCGRATSLDDVRNPCDGNPTEMRECDRDFQTCFDALMGVKWGEWEHWSTCSQSCGIGRRLRSRQCLTKGRSLGPGCSGANQEQQPCLRSKC
ncbi:A disintegrin and metalloproteinase with thrombospondin motifs adt-1-like [Asterias rubens]|uniref:A disintegrin and metalloproteinase with thrombospondin motifs adt-1-like n=1 Tax=Asterias rubens TaxID=7604 RepID=UPI0014552B59|nr:A disintegrin and metalloproteinase with thrombospondin motifs adt-1-like [Asterias rubens]